MPKRNRPRGKIRAQRIVEPLDLSGDPDLRSGEMCEICGEPGKAIAATRTKAGTVSFPVCSAECAMKETDRLARLPDIGMEDEDQIDALPDTIETVLAEMEEHRERKETGI